MLAKKKGKCPTSTLMVAPAPAPPSRKNWHQRIQRNEDHAPLRIEMPIQPFDDSFEELKQQGHNSDLPREVREFAERRKVDYEEPYGWKRHFRCFDVNLALIERYGMGVEEVLMKKCLIVGDFAPMESPYIIDIIAALVNSIEKHCIQENYWTWMLCEWPSFSKEAVELMGYLLFIRNQVPLLERVADRLFVPLQLATLRLFLSAFSTKFLHLFKRDILDIAQRPLYDQFIRPNKDLRLIVQHALLPYSRTTIDTTAFLMLHLQHFFLVYQASASERAMLTKIYGPLLISFSERPLAINKSSTFFSEEASLLEAILEVCDSRFWNHLGMLKINAAFDNIDYFAGFLPDLYDVHAAKEEEELRNFRVRDFIPDGALNFPEPLKHYHGNSRLRVARPSFLIGSEVQKQPPKKCDAIVRTKPWHRSCQDNCRKQQESQRQVDQSEQLNLAANDKKFILVRSKDFILQDVQKVLSSSNPSQARHCSRPVLPFPSRLFYKV